MRVVYYYITIQLYNNTLIGKAFQTRNRCGKQGPRSHRETGGRDASPEGGELSCIAGKRLTHTAGDRLRYAIRSGWSPAGDACGMPSPAMALKRRRFMLRVRVHIACVSIPTLIF